MRTIIYAIFALLICSCATTTQTADIPTITLAEDVENYPIINDSDMSVNYEILELKSSEKKNTVPTVERAIEYDGRLYIIPSLLKGENLFIFNSDGTLIKKLNNGRGRGEFYAAYNINIDPQSKQLEVLDRMQCAILQYTLDGEFVSKIDLPRKNMSGFYKLSNNHYLINTPIHTFKEEKDTYFKRVIDGEVVQEYLNKPKDLGNWTQSTQFFKGDDGLYCSGTYGNICYKFDENTFELKPYLRIEPILDINDSNLKDRDLLKNKFSRFSDFRRFGNFMVFNVTKGKTHRVIYDSKTERLYRHILPFSFKFIGASETEELYSISIDSIEDLRDYTPQTKIEQNIIDELLQKDLTKINTYIIRISYSKN